jgi:phenylalanyl-tRNA synthetase beta chain
MLIKEIAGGTIASDIIDVYPNPEPKKEVALKYHYLKKLSGKNYHPDSVKKILQALGFSIQLDSGDTLVVEVPYHKPDVTLPADLVEEILRIDGLDNIDIPTSIRISPSIEENYKKESLKEKLSNVLTGLGFTEILTNSITNSAYYSEEELKKTVRLLNNLSSELDIMRPTMLPTALEVLAFNINHKNNSLRFFEFGKTYATDGPGLYSEQEHLSLYVTGAAQQAHWKKPTSQTDIYYIKGIAEALLRNLGTGSLEFSEQESKDLEEYMEVKTETGPLVKIGKVNRNLSSRFDIRQPVFVAEFNWAEVVILAARPVRFREIPKYPAVERDLALVVPVQMKYASISEQINKLKLPKLKEVKLFDVFESEKLGAGRKSLAVNFTFLDEEKTLTDKEIDAWMNRIMITLEKELHAEIRK